MRLNRAIVASTYMVSVQAWSYSQGVGAGLDTIGSVQQQQILGNETLEPNSSTSLSIYPANGSYFNFRLYLSEVGLPGVDSSISNPRAVVTKYDIDWPSNTTYSEIFSQPGPSCLTTTDTAFKKKVTKKAGMDGDCTGPLGDDCVSALQNYSPNCDSAFLIPAACQDAFDSVDETFSFDLANENKTILDNIYATTSRILSPSDSKKQYEDATEQMYFALFRTGQRPSIPVCVRATSGALSLRAGSITWALVAAAAAVGWVAS